MTWERMAVGMVAGCLAMALAGPAAAQDVISAQSGLIHHIVGDVFVNDEPVKITATKFPQMNNGDTLRTVSGRAEVLLSPGVFFRTAERSAFTITSTKLADTRLELLRGAFLLECANFEKDTSVTLTLAGTTITVDKRGLYRIDADEEPAVLKVLEGRATVQMAGSGEPLDVKRGRVLALNGGDRELAKFDRKETDAFYAWAESRAEHMAMANMGAARTYHQRKMSWAANNWIYNPYFGLFTFMPMRGMYVSPFGYTFWSPRMVYVTYQPAPVYRDMGPSMPSYRTAPSTSGGYSGVVASSPSSTAATAASPGGGTISRGSSQGSGSSR
jgi:hypothetical protein